VYERRLIVKHIQIHGSDPLSNEPLGVHELVTIKSVGPAKPRNLVANSLPGLLQSFQNEWDSLLVESFELKKQLDTLRQELSHAMYQNDAACRVIARLQKERDGSRKELETLRETLGGLPDHNSVDKGFPGLDETSKDVMTAKSQELSAERKSRQVSFSLTTVEQLQQFHQLAVYPPHKASDPGILCLDIHSRNNNLVITGGVDETAIVFDRSTERKVATLAGHEKEVTSVLFHPTQEVYLTGSADNTVRIWSKQEGNAVKSEHRIKVHRAPVVQMSMHATNQFFLTASKDRTWGFHEIEGGRTLLQVTEPDNQPLTCAMFHPDGLILATGTEDSLIRIWELKTQKNVATFQGHSSAINDLRFSENGYYLATAADNVLKLWDLRGPKNVNSLKLNLPIRRLCYDYSGKYLSVVLGNQLKIFTGKTLDPVVTLEGHDDIITDVKFGSDASFLATTSMDRNLKFWGL